MKWFAIIFIAIVVEAITEYLKMSFPKFGESKLIVPLTIVLGVGVAIAYNADLMAVAGLSADIPYVGNVLTGIIIARGSNYLYDFIGKLSEAKAEYDAFDVTEFKPTEDAEG